MSKFQYQRSKTSGFKDKGALKVKICDSCTSSCQDIKANFDSQSSKLKRVVISFILDADQRRH